MAGTTKLDASNFTWAWTATYAGTNDPAPTLDLSGETSNELTITDAMVDFTLTVTATAKDTSKYTGTPKSATTEKVKAAYSVTVTQAAGGTITTSIGSDTTALPGTEITLTATPDEGYTFSSWAVTAGGNPVTIEDNKFTMGSQAVNITATFTEKSVKSIAVKNAPTKTTYASGEHFDPTGLVITVTYSDDSTADVPYAGNEAKFTFSPTTSTALTTENNSVTISYGTPSKTTTKALTVRELESITVKTNPTLTYTVGDTFDPTGLVLQLNYTAGDPSEVAYSADNENEFSFTFQDSSSDLSPQPTTLNTSVKKVKIEYAGKTVTKALTVSKAAATSALAKTTDSVIPSAAKTYDLTANTLTVTAGTETLEAGDDKDYKVVYKTKGSASDAEFGEAIADPSSVDLSSDTAWTVQVTMTSDDYAITESTLTYTVAVKPAGITLTSITIAGEQATITGSLGADWSLTGGKFYLSTDGTFGNVVKVEENAVELTVTPNEDDTKTFEVTNVSGLTASTGYYLIYVTGEADSEVVDGLSGQVTATE